MADEDLRELERAVRTKGDAPGRIRLARALERAGRRDEIYAVLRPVIADPEARRTLCELPAWRNQEADDGCTNVIDVPPLRRSPRVRRVRENSGDFVTALLANEAGLVVAERGRGNRPVLRVIDPDSGELRFEMAGDERSVAIVGSRLLSHVEARDLETGHIVDVTAEERRSRERAAEGSVSADGWTVSSKAGEVVAVELGSGQELWRARCAGADERSNVQLRLDAEGVLVVSDAPVRESELIERDGRVAWSSSELRSFDALGRDFVVGRLQLGRREQGILAVVDRATGQRRAALTTPFTRSSPETPGSVVVARDVVFFVSPSDNAIVATSMLGDVLWRMSMENVERIMFLAPGAERLYAATLYGAVYELTGP